ncbi:hypothetical protein RUM43_007659 [Polyplax serrata]|uniref:Uncharacterized protein n=1 Tax=Polyplax serrata TaxID=468196 RepID=A0AAN8PD19_POLSC
MQTLLRLRNVISVEMLPPPSVQSRARCHLPCTVIIYVYCGIHLAETSVRHESTNRFLEASSNGADDRRGKEARRFQ